MSAFRTIRTTVKWTIATPVAVLLWSGLVLGLPAGAGFIYYKTGSMLVDFIRARHWLEVPATIQSVNLESHGDADGSSYKVTCTYTYPYLEQEFTGHRVGLDTGADNIGSWQQQTYDRLYKAQANRQTVPCFVNPDHPEQALLDREIRYPLTVFLTIGMLAFGGVSLIIDWAVIAWFFEKRRRREALSEPDKPWLANPQWAAGVIPSGLKSNAVIAAVAALFWNITSAPAMVLLPGALRQGWQYSAIGGFIFTAIGVALVVCVYRRVSQLRRFGYSRFELDTIPGVIGGQLRGRLVLAGELPAIDELQAKLVCLQTLPKRSEGEPNPITAWEDIRHFETLPISFGQAEITLPIEYDIPAHALPSMEFREGNAVEWRVLVTTRTDGADLKLQFGVPVYRTDESPPPDVSAGTQLSGPPLADADVPEGIEHGVGSDGLQQFVVHCGTGWGDRIGTFVAIVIFFSMTWVLAFVVPDFGCFRYVLIAGLGGVSLVILAILIMSTGTWRTAFDLDAIKIDRRIGPIHRERTIPFDGIQDVSFCQCASKGAQKWFRIVVQRSNGRKVTIAAMIPGDLAADWFVRQVRRHIESRQAT